MNYAATSCLDTRRYHGGCAGLWGVLVLVTGFFGPVAGAQVFDSTSDGSDGALDFSCPSPPCEILFDPAALGLDLDDDNVFHFTTINVPAGVTVRMRALELNYAPVYWLATGPVTIDGTVDLSGDPGHPSGVIGTLRSPSMPGPGGFPGGIAGLDGDSPATPGLGPGGGGTTVVVACIGAGGAHAGPGRDGARGSSGNMYGNEFLLPLVGGSGGSGSPLGCAVGGGGAGGGAVLIASSQSIVIDGKVIAVGGTNPRSFCGSTRRGGDGSGGAIRLIAPVIDGVGLLNTRGGGVGCAVGAGGGGRIRLEAFQLNFTGPILAGGGATLGTVRRETLAPGTSFLPVNPTGSVRVVDVDGTAVPDLPSGSFLSADVTINQSTVLLTIEARNIPLGTIVTLHVLPEIGPDQVVETTPLAGTLGLSTATASVTFEFGFSRFMVHALWTP